MLFIDSYSYFNFCICCIQVEVPSCELVLAARDDAAEFDDSLDQQQTFNDDPR